ncbi:hypothetical protein HRG_008920 [Hirsutella rhossiliensis]|uniref:Uncharacterized protein n=1 Tax=Hirsutella rhossiliensis TaxID=111463 RepID=A0A9P8SFC3_9HYPO|nr:uncharacterized protein HRG_08920 [Hirsutella rhossiliensis]KAH0959899.1 hypothetical protein HRG_08920 [Hirsutella rhossiliensis]
MAMYRRSSLFNRSCQPNVEQRPDRKSRMVFTAARDLVEGEGCLISSFDCVEDTTLEIRQRVLLDMFQFSFICERCIREHTRA